MKYVGFKKTILLLFICNNLTVNILSAQEIPSRINEGVTATQPKGAKNDVYAGLKLTREQQKKLQELNKERREMLKAVSEDETLEPKEKKTKAREINRQQDAKREAILTPAQNEKFRQNVKEIRAGGDREDPARIVVNNPGTSSKKDENGLSRDSKKRTSNKKSGGLYLSKEQQQKLKEWNEEYTARLRSIRGDATLNSKQKKDQLEQLAREDNMQVAGILTVEQKTAWDEKLRQQKLTSTPQKIQNNPRLLYFK